MPAEPAGSSPRPRGTAVGRRSVRSRGLPDAVQRRGGAAVLAHQARMTNLITRVGWEARLADAAPSATHGPCPRGGRGSRRYLLFVDEAPLARPVRGTSGFAERFAPGPARYTGPVAARLRSAAPAVPLPCSYMIYTEAFDALPDDARDAVYARLAFVLSGRETGARYRSLSPADRRAIVQILRETKKDLPASFAGSQTS